MNWQLQTQLASYLDERRKFIERCSVGANIFDKRLILAFDFTCLKDKCLYLNARSFDRMLLSYRKPAVLAGYI
jgi:hypothetical protein